MGTVLQLCGQDTTTTNSGFTGYNPLGGRRPTAVTTESNVTCRVRAALVFQNLLVLVNANSLNGATTVTVRKDSANGNLSVSVPAAGTGFFQDTVDSDSFVSGDTADYANVTGGSSGTIELAQTGVTSTNPSSFVRISNSSSTGTVVSASGFDGFDGVFISPTSPETMGYKVRGFGGSTFSNLNIIVTANSTTGPGSFKFRKNAANGNQSAAIPSGTTGEFEDTVDTDVVSDGDAIDYSYLPGSGGSMTVTNVECHLTSAQGSYPSIVAQQTNGPGTANATNFWLAMGNVHGTSESTFQTMLRMAGGFLSSSDLAWDVTANPFTSITFKVRRNGADGTEAAAAVGTGYFEDLVDADDFVNGDLFDYSSTSVGGPGTLTWTVYGSVLSYRGAGGGGLLQPVEQGAKVYQYRDFEVL